MLRVRQGSLKSEIHVQAEFNFAAVRIRQNLVNEETDDMDPEDRFAQSLLTQIVLYPGGLQLYVTIISQAGTSREVILPIAITPTELSIQGTANVA